MTFFSYGMILILNEINYSNELCSFQMEREL